MTDRRAARLELAHVTKRYGEVAAVRDVSFTVAADSLVTLLRARRWPPWGSPSSGTG